MLRRSFFFLFCVCLVVASCTGVTFAPNTGNQQSLSSRPMDTEVMTDNELHLEQFISTVVNAEPDEVVGVYIPGKFALPVEQQPKDKYGRNLVNYVTTYIGEVTEFALTKSYGVIGLLAHNNLSGAQFYRLQLDEQVLLVYGTGKLESYTISRVEKYRALEPTNVYTKFIDLADESESVITATDVFNKVFTQKETLVFQTCLTLNGNGSGGRMFIISEKDTEIWLKNWPCSGSYSSRCLK